jgi:transposase
MLAISANTPIYFYTGRIDFRKGIDGLDSLCKVEMGMDSMSGAVFVFLNSAKTAIKLLLYDGQGYWLCQKRLSRGKFQWKINSQDGANHRQLLLRELQVLIWNGNPGSASMQSDWKNVSGPPQM